LSSANFIANRTTPFWNCIIFNPDNALELEFYDELMLGSHSSVSTFLDYLPTLDSLMPKLCPKSFFFSSPSPCSKYTTSTDRRVPVLIWIWYYLVGLLTDVSTSISLKKHSPIYDAKHLNFAVAKIPPVFCCRGYNSRMMQ